MIDHGKPKDNNPGGSRWENTYIISATAVDGGT